MRARNKKLNKGFTIIELIVAITVFITVMTIAMGAIFSTFNSNTKAKNMKTALSNLNIALESMSREIRFGRIYHCGSTGTLTVPQNCPTGSSFFTFLSSGGDQIAYRLTGTTIEKQDGASGSWIVVTGSEITIESLTFYTLGAIAADTFQPKTVIIVRGRVGATGAKGTTRFAIQTLVSQRAVDR